MKTAWPTKDVAARAALIAFPTFATTGTASQEYNRHRDAAVILRGDPAYAMLEEAALSAGLARPHLEGPINVWQLCPSDKKGMYILRLRIAAIEAALNGEKELRLPIDVQVQQIID